MTGTAAKSRSNPRPARAAGSLSQCPQATKSASVDPAIAVARLILPPPKRYFATFSDYRYLRLISENLPDILLKMDV